MIKAIVVLSSVLIMQFHCKHIFRKFALTERIFPMKMPMLLLGVTSGKLALVKGLIDLQTKIIR